MTKTNPLNTPWSLHFDRDGTEDFGIICDAEGNDLVASHLPSTRIAEKTFESGTFWLPESDNAPTPRRVRQMQVMTAAPNLLAMLKVAIATADPAQHQWVKEAREVIAEATGQPCDAKEAEAARHLYRAAPRMYAALELCENRLKDYRDIARAVALLLHEDDDAAIEAIEHAYGEALAALAQARGETAF